jgi:hypothetical protein
MKNPMPNAQVCVYLTIHITKLQYINSVSLSVTEVLRGGGRESPVKHGVRGASIARARRGGSGRTGGGARVRKDRAGGSSTGAFCTRFTLVLQNYNYKLYFQNLSHSTCIHQDPSHWKSWCLHCFVTREIATYSWPW